MVCAFAQASAIYTVTDLGGTSAYSVNDAGAAAGVSFLNGQQSGFTYTPAGSHFYSAGPLGSESIASGINDLGETVGTILGNGGSHGVVWSGGAVRDLGGNTSASAINDSGWITGGNGQAFVMGPDGIESLGALPGGDWSTGRDINAAGAVTGYGDIGNGHFQAFLWMPGSPLIALGTLGGRDSYGIAINAWDEVSGYGTTRNGYTHAFAGTPGQLRDLGTLGGSSSYAYGLNDAGIVVGSSYVDGDTELHAFAYLGGVMVDLNTLLPSGSGWNLISAFGINDRGQIAGQGEFNGQLQGFLLSPGLLDPGTAPRMRSLLAPTGVPEPGTESLIAAGMLLLLGLGMRGSHGSRREI